MIQSRRRFLGGMLACIPLLARPALAQDAPPSRLRDGQPSLTAQSTARMRAAHQLIDDQPLILNDPLALRILGAKVETDVRAYPQREAYATMPIRALVCMRARYTEDELAQAVARGVRQYVILGAGLDTFAYRNPHPASRLRVFEVDHPSTQVWKRQRLTEVGIAIPPSMSFAPVDFEKQTLADGLRQAGFKADEPAFFSMLGVVVYLTRDAVMETLKYVASLPAGTEMVFDYSVPTSTLNEDERIRMETLARSVAGMGEPFLTHFEPPALAAALRQAGFTRVENLSPDRANERYFKNRGDDFRMGQFAHVMKAGR
jgi:methyltransferase (TIGR00027 family)